MPHRTPLGDLIQSTQNLRGWSNRRVEQMAGGKSGLGQANLTKLKNGTLISIKGETLVSIAEVLGLPTELVVRAALRSLKTPIDLNQETGAPEDAIRIDPNLSDSDKQTLLRMLTFMRAEAGETRGNTAPMNQAGKKPAQPDYQPGPDLIVGPGEEGYIPPPPGYEYDLAADETPSEGVQRRCDDRNEGA